MTEFWESSFRDKQAMWGFDPADSAIAAVDLFRKNGLNKILIPGFGYGRNAKNGNGNNDWETPHSSTSISIALRKYNGVDSFGMLKITGCCHSLRIHPSHLQIFEDIGWMSEGISQVLTD